MNIAIISEKDSKNNEGQFSDNSNNMYQKHTVSFDWSNQLTLTFPRFEGTQVRF